MVFESLYRSLDLPKNASVPDFVLRKIPGDQTEDKELIFPSPFWTRAQAKSLTLADIRDGAYGMATELLAPDVEGGPWEKNDVGLFVTENQYDYLLVSLGLMQIGAIPALLNPQYKGVELEDIMHKVHPRAMFVSVATFPAVEDAVKSYAAKGDKKPVIYVFDQVHERNIYRLLIDPGKKRRANGDNSLEKVKIDPITQTAVYCFSSGTSGPPKVVCLSHFNLIANVVQITVALGGRVNKPRFDDANWFDQPIGPPQDGINEFHLSILPQFHCYGLLTAIATLFTGTPCVVFSKFDVKNFFIAVEKYKVTFMFVVPPILLALASSPLAAEYDLGSIKSFASGAATLSKELCDLVRERRGIPVTDGYGMTEMSPIISLQTTRDIESGRLNVGRLVPNTDARVIDLSTGKDVGEDVPGELWLRGPQLMLGYLDNNEANEKSFSPSPADMNHFFNTGDIVSIDKDGFVTIHDRVKDIIKFNGYQVSASELEGLAQKNEYVLQAAVAGVVDHSNAVHNELPWAFVVSNEKGQDVPEEKRTKSLLTLVNSRVPGYKKLRGVTWLNALPTSSAGKILKRELRSMVKI
ncbi:hypothetical protein MVES1_002027 [Malassezia vespertilionis]|uniref:AMP-dependent synthetase/ligase domain-containing protein n=1 Tax=Malassezia vespertilionis TaxID=2020962 RepID=A0A2N1JC35_9BASI|nr:uncharacterized protein MVES1_002027 [Malassezia vespertilionis]PKI84109.1 hypothetical protein MVES_001919 [Malassezia vespertilionis]WFD06673.1 hypothetical protein MVES1_002027 [Malassezia vespertilionis]